jgi:DNA repair protein RecN (Recombination protein N)
MIGSLRIRNLATIEDLEIRFKDGFSILTGETGAGKSIIIDGIKLVLGERASPELIRTGKTEAVIEAVFRIPPETRKAADPGLQDEGEVLIQRQIPLEGSGKAYLNGVLVPLKKLREMGPALVDIYGQNDHIFLLQVENHLLYLDDYLGLVQRREEVAGLAQELRRLVRQRSDLETRKREREQRLDFLGYQIKELEGAGLRPGELEGLQAERRILKNAEKIAGLVDRALDLSYLEENSIQAGLARLQEAVRELGTYDQAFRTFDESLGQTAIAVRELADCLIKYKDRQSLGPERLEELEERLAVLDRLRRKYGDTIEDMLVYLKKAKEEHGDLQKNEERLADLEAEISRVWSSYQTKAGTLSRLRRQGASGLEQEVEREIALLGMKKARFKVRVESRTSSALDHEKAADTGLDDVEFLISPNPGEELRPLRKVASGGELSRIMLALKTVGREGGALKTLIFDEIDSGIGGKTAECIAQKLRGLAGQHQVICITHLPQIASFAPHHYRIEKSVARERTFTTVKELEFEDRVEEISRLMSGSRMTSTSLQSAREMLSLNLKEDDGGRRIK